MKFGMRFGAGGSKAKSARMSQLLLGSLIAAAAGPACTGDDTVVVVSVVTDGPSFTSLDSLDVTVVNRPLSDNLSYPPRTVPIELTPSVPTTLSVSFSEALTGTLDLCVEARRGGTGIAAGGARFDLAAGVVNRISVVVSDTTPACAAVSFDPGAATTPGRERPNPGGSPLDGGVAVDCTALGAQGCSAGSTCALSCGSSGETQLMCTVAGLGEPGSACVSDADCKPGTQCFVDDACGVRTCRAFCEGEGGCPGGGSCSTPIFCSDDPAAPSAARICSIPCDPVGAATQGCVTGQFCFVFPNEIVDCDCKADTRSGTNGDGCVDSRNCAPGNICVTSGSESVCRPLCRLAQPTCAASTTCTQLTNPTYREFGACLP